MEEAGKNAVQQVTIFLKAEEKEFLDAQARIEGISFNDLLRRSIILERFFLDQQRKQRKFFFGVPGRPLREVIRD